MTEQRQPPSRLVAGDDEPLIGLILNEGGQERICYFSSEEEADRVVIGTSIEDALELAGAWKDLNWDEMEAALDRIRHEAPPSSPLSL